MKEVFIGLGLVAVIAAVLAGLGVFGTEVDYRVQKHYAPLQEQVRRNTFEQSQAHVEGINTDIARYRVDFATAKSDDEKAAIRQEILHTAGQLSDPSLLTPDNAAFVRSLGGAQ